MVSLAPPDTAALSGPRVEWSRRRLGLPRDLLVYLGFGGIAAGVNLLSGWLMYGAGSQHIPYWLATGSAAATGLVTNFALNYWLNFRFAGRSALRQFITFVMVSGLGVVLTSLLATAIRALLIGLFGPELFLGVAAVSSDFAAHVAAVGLVVLYSYPAHKRISFNVGLRARLRQLAASIGQTI
ncbi:MAG: GtrA family protein [Alphaproteobacteria bacterium]|nr:GtrA family protein [Alphaproteobacteria bacterium]